MKRLVLLDIDGTLLNANGAGRAAMKTALQACYGTAGAIDSYRFGGRCDRYTVFRLLRDEGVEETTIEQHFPTLGQRMADVLHAGPFDINALSGGLTLYNMLTSRPDVILGVVTGNFAESGQAKLQLAGYDPAAIAVGAYGSESDQRDDLPHLALERANTRYDLSLTGEDVVIIGDTVSDITCGRAVGARVMSVVTGYDSRDHLTDAQPDALLDDLSDTDDVMAFILR